MLNLTTGPSAVLWVGALVALAALAFARAAPVVGSGPTSPGVAAWLFRHRHGIAAGCLVLAIANTLTDHGVRPTNVKDHVETADKYSYDRWNSFSRITVSQHDSGPPAMFGASSNMPRLDVDQRSLLIDGGAGTALYRFDGDLESLGFLRYDVTNIAYAVPNLKTGAVIGVGGGRDVLSQRLYGMTDITGVEINPIIIDVLRTRFADYSTIAALDGVRFEIDEARSWFARTARSFDVIQMSLIDTWAATGAGAFTLTENGLYTVEAWQRFLGRLNPAGVFSVSRWFDPDAASETTRLLSLGVASLLDAGVTDPRQHLILVTRERIATLMVSRRPFSSADAAAIERTTQGMEFSVLAAPWSPPADERLRRITESSSMDALLAASEIGRAHV